jgi:hypothetical protein
MSLKNTLGSLALLASLVAGASGCVVRAHGRVNVPVAYVEVEEEPPPPRVVVVDSRPGFVWIEGRWNREGNRWAWRDGYWERERSGYVWEQGRWDRRGRGHVWVEGRWRSGGAASGAVYTAPANNGNGNGPNVRDHRTNQPPPPPPPADNGPTVRDHRNH